METTDYKICTFCKQRNRADAIFCESCGKPFQSSSDSNTTTTEVNKPKITFQEDLEEKIEKKRLEPAEGIAIYLFSKPNPIEVRLEDEFIIGRLTEATEEKVVDLTSYDAFDLGVSRRHLKVRRVGNGYEVVDLNSRNGTWVNERSLEPQIPFTVRSGSQIRLGNLRIVISFRPKF